MKYDGILLVFDEGYKCYSDLLDNIKLKHYYNLITWITDDCNYHNSKYVCANTFEKINNDDIFCEFKYGEHIYALLEKDIRKKRKVPVFTITTKEYKVFKESEKDINLMSIYIYSDENAMSKNKAYFQGECIYNVNGKRIDSVCDLIDRLWILRKTGGGLSRDLINKLVECDLLVKNGKVSDVSNASYDLRLGDEYYYAGEIKQLTDKQPFITIEPYDYVIASCKEMINMPRDVSGRFDISVKLFCQGLILSNSTQVDPGFRGKLFCLLFNTSNKTVYLKRGMHYVTLEFNKLIEPTTPYSGEYVDQESIVAYLPPVIMHGAINELKKEIELLKEENKKMQSIYLSVVSLFLAIISVLMMLS